MAVANTAYLFNRMFIWPKSGFQGIFEWFSDNQIPKYTSTFTWVNLQQEHPVEHQDMY